MLPPFVVILDTMKSELKVTWCQLPKVVPPSQPSPDTPALVIETSLFKEVAGLSLWSNDSYADYYITANGQVERSWQWPSAFLLHKASLLAQHVLHW